jgi:hypothetical protein
VSVAERVIAYAVSALVIALVLSPLGWEASRDSFPLSSYPMFAHGRRSPVLHAVYAITTDAGGERTYVPPHLVANREVLQARAVLDRAARGGKKAAVALCREIAGRVDPSGAAQVTILRGKHDAIRYFESGELGTEQVLARCPVAPP